MKHCGCDTLAGRVSRDTWAWRPLLRQQRKREGERERERETERQRERERERQRESKVNAADNWKKEDKARMEPLASLYEALRL